MSMRVVFAGSPSVAVPYLRALVTAGFEVVAVITRTDSPQGRTRTMTPTPVAIDAEDLGLTVIKTNCLRDIDIPESDLGVVVAYGGLVPSRLLSTPVYGWVNVHFSVLPEYRGAAPVQRALWDGRDDSGITIFRLVEELDAGPVFFTRSIPFEADETASDALHRISTITTDELIATVRLIDAGAIEPTEQQGEPSVAAKLTRADGRIDWSLNAGQILDRIRAVSDEPGAFTELSGASFGIVRATLGDGDSLGVGVVTVESNRVQVGTGEGNLELLAVKPAGKSVMTAADWARGLRDSVVFS